MRSPLGSDMARWPSTCAKPSAAPVSAGSREQRLRSMSSVRKVQQAIIGMAKALIHCIRGWPSDSYSVEFRARVCHNWSSTLRGADSDRAAAASCLVTPRGGAGRQSRTGCSPSAEGGRKCSAETERCRTFRYSRWPSSTPVREAMHPPPQGDGACGTTEGRLAADT